MTNVLKHASEELTQAYWLHGLAEPRLEWVTDLHDVSSITLFRFAVCFQTAQSALWYGANGYKNITEEWHIKMTAKNLQEAK